MRSSKSRSRNKSRGQRPIGNVVNRVFDSSGPEGKVRGTPQQIIEKYLTLARDAQLSNDRVAEQSFFQHAEHYTRMLGEAQREQAERQQQGGQGDDQRDAQGNGQGGNPGQNGNHGGQQQNHNPASSDRREQRPERREDRRDDRNRSGEAGEKSGAESDDARAHVKVEAKTEPATDAQDDTLRLGDNDSAPAFLRAPVDKPAAEEAGRETAADAPAADDDGISEPVAADAESGPVETPENAAPTARARAPRSRAPSARPRAPRARRSDTDDKPAPDAPAADG